MHPKGFDPMLASTTVSPRPGEYAFEPKLDRWRVIVHVRDGVRVFTRPGRDATESVPELAALAGVVPDGTVLDGEVVAGSGRARSFYGLGGALHGRPARRDPVTFAIVDALAVEGRVVTRLPYRERRALLDDLALRGPTWCVLPSWTNVDLRALLEACAENDVEGVVAKRFDGRYECGRRSSSWVKIKTDEWRSMHAPRRRESTLV